MLAIQRGSRHPSALGFRRRSGTIRRSNTSSRSPSWVRRGWPKAQRLEGVRTQDATTAPCSSADAFPVPRSPWVTSRSEYAMNFACIGFSEVAPVLVTFHTGHVDRLVRRDPSARLLLGGGVKLCTLQCVDTRMLPTRKGWPRWPSRTLCPSSVNCRDSWLTTHSTPGTELWSGLASLSIRTLRSSPPIGQESWWGSILSPCFRIR